VVFLTPEEYAAISDSQTVSRGFFDRNLANQTERFGIMAHVYSTYELRFDRNSAKPVARGIKSFELLNSDNRWYIVQCTGIRSGLTIQFPITTCTTKLNKAAIRSRALSL
jgi:hypothetical protein